MLVLATIRYPYFQLSGKLLLKSLTEIKDCTATCTVHVTMPSCTLNFMYSCKKGLSFDIFFAIRHEGFYCLKIKAKILKVVFVAHTALNRSFVELL